MTSILLFIAVFNALSYFGAMFQSHLDYMGLGFVRPSTRHAGLVHLITASTLFALFNYLN